MESIVNVTKPAFITLMLICGIRRFSEKNPANTRGGAAPSGEPHFPEDIDIQKLGPTNTMRPSFMLMPPR